MKLTITDALKSTNESFYISNDDYETLDWKSDKPKPTKKWCEEKLLELQAIEDSQEYSRNRVKEYPPIGEQLDYIYHNGLTKWKNNMIKPIKDKHPKP